MNEKNSIFSKILGKYEKYTKAKDVSFPVLHNLCKYSNRSRNENFLQILSSSLNYYLPLKRFPSFQKYNPNVTIKLLY